MHTAKRFLFLVLIIFIAVNCVFAQTDDDREQTIEELYLSQDIELRLIRNQALSDERDTKLLAIENLRAMVDNGKISEDDTVAFTIVETLATEAYSREVREGNRQINNFPIVRQRACEILGDIGGDTAKKVLVNVIRYDNEPIVLAEAVYGLGKIGLNDINDDVKVTDVIAEMLHKDASKRAPDNNLAFSTLLAIEKLAEANDGVNNQELFNAIVEVYEGNYIAGVKEKALLVLKKLGTY